MSVKGVVSTLCDPTIGAVITDDWCASIAGLGADAMLVPLICAADGALPTALYARGMDTAGTHTLPVLGRFTRAFTPVGGESATLYPNMLLYQGLTQNRLLSPYIDAVTLRQEGFARQMVQHGLTVYAAANEVNLKGLISQGTSVAAASDKAAALAPSVAAALAWQTAHRLKAVGAKTVYAGSLSLLPQTGLDGQNPYFAAYVEAFYAFLAAEGVRPPYPFDGWVVNSEGVWPAGRFAQAVKVLRMIMAAHGDTGAIIVGEHGVTNAALPAQEAAYVATYQEMAGAVEDAHFFQHFGASPYLGAPLLYGNYGAIQYRVNPPALVPGADYKLAPVVRRMFGKT